MATPEPPDLQSQLEDILNAVWASEADWTLMNKIDLAVKNEEIEKKKRERGPTPT